MKKYEITKKTYDENGDERSYKIVHEFDAADDDAALEDFASYCRMADIEDDEALILGTEAEDFAIYPIEPNAMGAHYNGHPRIGLF